MVFIWVRRTVDWSDEAAFRAQLAPDFRPVVDLWDATFSMPYHGFRHAVREIACESLAEVRGVTISASWDAIPDGALVLPTDDDDWFAPHVAEVVVDALDGRPGVRWKSSFVEVKIDAMHVIGSALRRALPGVGPKYLCTTNNYGLFKQPGFELRLERHTRASYWLAEDHRRLPMVDRRLSTMNRTLASTTSLIRHGRAIDRPRLLRKYGRYRRLYGRRLHPDLAWAQPYVDRMAALMERLEVAG